ncbi:C40 family peptidase [Naumannella halotolerans]|uniref:Cell wall-associated NlpC family hydrolase n=1 Tax=Naumannella halotolerans TaxID=993414 RepID=A0A4V3EN78_9ACTN|nr:C40 family peptidase [Naumannella halotolerans]TDT32768.1 cell wall-associated NlpC family hydrolase [Naumannella halotolerans]
MASRSDLTARQTFVQRSRTLVGTFAATVGLVIGGVVAAPGALADPDELEAAKEKVDQLQQEAAALDQDALAAEEELEKAKQALAAREDDEAEQQEKIDELTVQLRQVALAQYQDRVIDPSTRVVFSADSDNFVSRFSTIQHITDSQNGVLQDFQASEADLASMRRESEADVATIAEQEKKAKEAQEESKAKVAEAEAVLERLTEEERQRIAEEERQQEEEAAAAAAVSDDSSDAETSESDSDSDADSASSGSSESDSDPAAGVPDSDRVGKVLATAKAQQGKPYVYAATGPNSFDCSGLTSYAYKAAGVSLPRVSRDQANVGTRVSRSELQPGDLVFYYSPISHVALYVGNGQIIHASRPGKPVGYASVDSMPFAGATRVL